MLYYKFAAAVVPSKVNTPLPVELVAFTSSVNRDEVKLNWSTSMERNNSGFDIERKPIS